MLIALDRKADDCTLPEVIQLRTPLTGYAKRPGVTWVMDNGAFSDFNEARFMRMAMDALNCDDCLWFAMPDVVGNHSDTIHMFYEYKEKLSRHWIGVQENFYSKKMAFVLQDGCNKNSVPWSEITAVFLGGTTQFKMSRDAWLICEEAKRRGKWVHIGRVNTPPRITYFHGLADSIDGSSLAKYDKHLDIAIHTIKSLEGKEQLRLGDFE